MAVSRYELRIVDRMSGQTVVRWPPGLDDERDLITAIGARVQAKGVGVFRTEAHVLADLRTALEELLYEAKAQVRP